MKKIFILHGWTYTTERWNDLVSQMKQSGFEPVMLRVPGLTEATDTSWTLDQYVQWLKDTLANEKDVTLIGHSNGGRIALAFAAEKPTDLNQLVLIDSAGMYHNELPVRFKRLVFGTIARIGKKLTSSEKLRAMLYKLVRASDYQKATPQMRQTMAHLITIDLTSRLSNITVPTLIVWGQKDRSTPVSDASVIHKGIKGSQLYVIKDAGHSPHATHANEVWQQIEKFIKRS